MNKDKVSIIIPVYNSEKFLKSCLESALEQTYTPTEIIAIDDGSTDNSLKVLREYGNEISVIEKENQGLASSLNIAIEKMSGTWFKWLSPDDILNPNAIEYLINEAKKFSENTIIYSNWELINENNEVIRDFEETNCNDLNIFDYNIRLLDGQQINVNTTLIPRILFDRGCIFRQLKDMVAIDYDFFLRAGIIYNTKFQLIEKNLLRYRIHQEQLSHKNITKTLSYITELKEEILSQIDQLKKEKYLKSLDEYKKKKSFSKKTMDASLKFSQILPDWISDPLLVFYLNKIRSKRN